MNEPKKEFSAEMDAAFRLGAEELDDGRLQLEIGPINAFFRIRICARKAVEFGRKLEAFGRKLREWGGDPTAETTTMGATRCPPFHPN